MFQVRLNRNLPLTAWPAENGAGPQAGHQVLTSRFYHFSISKKKLAH
jgi:hypothetical protein